MLRGTFIAISAASGMALAVSCASFSEGNPAPAGDDAGGDAGGLDAGVPNADASVAPGDRCTGTTRVRDPFDQAFDLGGWGRASGATVAAGMDGVPAPSLFAEAAENAKVNNTLVRAVDIGGHQIACIEMDLRFDKQPGSFTKDAYAEVLDVRGTGFDLFIEMRSEGFSLVPGFNTTGIPIPGFSPGSWQHLVVKIPFGGGGPPSAAIDGFAPARGPNAAPAQAAAVQLTLGLEASPALGASPGVRVHIDNFHFTSGP